MGRSNELASKAVTCDDEASASGDVVRIGDHGIARDSEHVSES